MLSAAAAGVAGAVTAALLAGGGSAGSGPARDSPRDQHWRQDIAYLARTLPRVHVHGVTGVSSRTWSAAATRLEAQVPRLTDGQVTLGVMRLVALLRDDETTVAGGSGLPFYLLGPRFPLGLQWVGGQLYVIAAPPAHRALLGSQLIAVSGVPVSRVLALLRPEIDHNNPGLLAFWETHALISADLLSWLGVTHSLRTAACTLRDPAGSQVTVRLTASLALTIPGLVMSQRATFDGDVYHVTWTSLDRLILTADGSADLAHVPLPMFQTRLERPYWLRVLAARHAVYLKYNACLSTNGFQQLAARAGRLLRRHPGFRLIVDLRDNPGGDSTPFEALIHAIRAAPGVNRRGRILGLVNQLSASSATLDAYHLVTQTTAVLVGQPSPDPLDEYGNSGHELRLPRSGLVIKYTTKTFDPRQIRMGIPDIYVAPTIRQILAGQDPALETALDYGRHQ